MEQWFNRGAREATADGHLPRAGGILARSFSTRYKPASRKRYNLLKTHGRGPFYPVHLAIAAARLGAQPGVAMPRLLGLDGLEVVGQAGDAQGDLRFIGFRCGLEDDSPDRHFGGAVAGQFDAAAQDVGDIGGGEFPVVALRQRGQVGRGLREGRGRRRRAAALSVVSVAEGAVLFVELGAGGGSAVLFLGRLVLCGSGADGQQTFARLKAAATKARAEADSQSQQRAGHEDVANGSGGHQASPGERVRLCSGNGKKERGARDEAIGTGARGGMAARVQ